MVEARPRPKLVEVTKGDDNITVITLARPPVNAINYQALSELREALLEAERNCSAGVILTSKLQKIFSAGLDMSELFQPDVVQAERFWTKLQDTWVTLYSLKIPTVASINGFCPAGGCIITLLCEYRVMVEGKSSIGLNETRIGAVAPKWLMKSLAYVIGKRQAEIAILRGTVFKPQEALEIGLADDIAADDEQAMAKCREYIAQCAKVDAAARTKSKLDFRSDDIEEFERNRQKDLAGFLSRSKDPELKKKLKVILAVMKKSKL